MIHTQTLLEPEHSHARHPRVGLGNIHEIREDSAQATSHKRELSTVCAGTAQRIVGGSGRLAASMRAPFRDTQNCLAKWDHPQRIAPGDIIATSTFPICDDGRSKSFICLQAMLCRLEYLRVLPQAVQFFGAGERRRLPRIRGIMALSTKYRPGTPTRVI